MAIRSLQMRVRGCQCPEGRCEAKKMERFVIAHLSSRCEWAAAFSQSFAITE